MITCKLDGGLGNYLFQIGATVTLAKKINTNAVFDTRSAIKVQGHIDTYKDNILRNIETGLVKVNNLYREPSFSYNEIPLVDSMMLQGYFQSEKYLDRSLILDIFGIDKVTKATIQEKYNVLFKKGVMNSAVSLHVRRGDYVNIQDRHPVLPIEYYEKARDELGRFRPYLVFSDDIQWCKEHFKGTNFIFIEGNTDIVDLYLMSMCQDNIIANSSFSWWGAYLNQTEDKKVIAPKTWFGINKQLNTKDLIPSNWITI